ncbi:MAG: phosphate/phosphite/phosphonate ABC transporter substrate-binding protein [Planctomycetes bacterium]|nr:phosphate/phosphite/phosphonate ABC transporter substrate-binding protein [Planctomycetota bacterium]
MCFIIVVAGLAYLWQYGWPGAPAQGTNPDAMSRMVGLTDPVTNRLADRFTDANDDLVADAPSDPAALLNPDTLVFSYVAVEQAEEYRDRWQPLVDHLQTALGRPVAYLLVRDPMEQLAAIRDGRLHIAGLNTGAVPLAVNQAGFVPVCKLPSADGTGRYHMVFVVPADSPLEGPTNLRGRELTLTNPNSNSGFKAPLVLLWSDFGLRPGRDFDFRMSGSHEHSIEGISNGTYEAAAVADDLVSQAVKAGTLTEDTYRVIYKSEPFPTAALGYAHNIDPALAEQIHKALLEFNWAGTPMDGTVAPVGHTQFIPADYKDDWSLIRRIDDAGGKKYEITGG